MSELPNGWAATTLGEIVALRGEKTDPAKAPELPFIGLGGIEPHTSQIINIGKASEVKSSVARFEAGDVLYSRLRPYLNKVTIPNFDGVASAEILALKANSATEPEFVRRRLMTGEFLDFAALLDKGDRPRVNYKDISRFPIALPPLPEQQRIVAKVDGLAARITRARKELDRIPALLAQYKVRLLELGASGELTRDWRGSIERTGWDEHSIEEIAEATFDGPFGSNLKSADYVAKGVRVVRLENIGRLSFIRAKETYISKKKYEGLKRHTLQANDVLFSSFVAEEVRVCRFPEDLPTAAINKADCFCVRPRASLCLPAFLTFRLAAPQTYEVLKESVHGATRPRISLKQLKALAFELPPINEQLEIVRRIESAFDWIDRLSADNTAAERVLGKLDAAILEKAFRGELVPQDLNDEPASVLLGRINAERAAAPKKKRGRKPESPKHMSVKKKSLEPRERLLQDSESWPGVGLPYEAIAMRNSGISHDDMRNALFDLMSGPKPTFRQRFDKDANVIVIQRVAS